MTQSYRHYIKEYWVIALATIGLAAGSVCNILGMGAAGNLIYISAIIIGGLPLFYNAILELKQGNFNVDIIALLGIGGSLFVGEYLAGNILVIMLAGGEALESYAQGKAKTALNHLLTAAPKLAHMAEKNRAGQYVDVPVEQLKINDHILIKPHEVIPTDCLISKGSTEVDQSNLTGESLPVHKSAGEHLLSGTVNLNGVIEAIVIKEVKDSAFSQIINLVADAEKNKAPLNKVADRYGAWFTPFVLIFAAGVYYFTRDLKTTYAVFVIATPCPLLIATPVAIISGIGRAAKKGAIIKNGNALEAIAQIDAVVLDKTGTLTKGNPEIVEITSLTSEYNNKDIANFSAALNQFSTHILAESFVKAADLQTISTWTVSEYHEELGKGLTALINDKSVVVGSAGLLKHHNITIDSSTEQKKEEDHKQGFITSFVAVNNQLVGYVKLTDTLRPDAKNLISDLKQLQVTKIVLATGDSQPVAERIGKEVGINDIRAETNPQTKAEIVKELQNQRYTVGMIGDGVNDAPAMSLAHVGIAIGARGSTIASEASDIVILTNNINRVTEAVTIGKKTLKIAKQGIWIGMALSLIGMIAASAGLLPPAIGAMGQEAIDIVAILNALRVLNIKTELQ